MSLGANEQHDLDVVIKYLRRMNRVSSIGLWGRSMGAVTALMYGPTDPSLAGMVSGGARARGGPAAGPAGTAACARWLERTAVRLPGSCGRLHPLLGL